MNTIDLLLTRRSVKAADMIEPGPSPEELNTLLSAAHRVPDHGKIGPWRFIVFSGNARAAFGTQLAAIYKEQNPTASDKLLEHQRNLLTRAPCVVAVIANPNHEHKVPVWEQELAVGAACQNLLVATHAMGYVGQWLTEWYSFDSHVAKSLQLNATERVAGFIYIGSVDKKPDERVRPDLQERISFWQPSE